MVRKVEKKKEKKRLLTLTLILANWVGLTITLIAEINHKHSAACSYLLVLLGVDLYLLNFRVRLMQCLRGSGDMVT